MPSVDRITVQQVSSWLANPLKSQTDYAERKTPGFHLRVNPRGSGTYGLSYRFEGRKRRYKIGRAGDLDLAKARSEALRLRGVIASGEDPQAQRQQEREERENQDTVKALFQRFLQEYGKTKDLKSIGERQRFFDRDVFPAIGDVSIQELDRSHVQRIIDKFTNAGKLTMANRAYSYMRVVLRWAKAKGVISNDPWIGVDTPGLKSEKSRDIILPEKKIGPFWHACELVDHAGLLHRLVLSTACRPGEALNAVWADMDLEGRWWTIPASSTKNAKPHRIWLNDPALRTLQLARADTADCPYVFANPSLSGPIKVYAKARKIINQAAGTEVSAHDLRRTAATMMAGKLDIDRATLSRILNHADSSITAIYDRAGYEAQRREAWERWGSLLSKLTN